MKKNRSAYVVIAALLAVLSFCVAWSQYGTSPVRAGNAAAQTGSGQGGASKQMLSLTPNALDSGTTQADSKNVDITIDQKAGTADNTGDHQTRDSDQPEKNPVADFFSTLATTIKSGLPSAQQVSWAQQVSIEVGNENENTDQDVTNEVHIDVEKYPIDNSQNAAVLIYHTHTTEAYTPDYPGEYVPVGDMRTNNKDYSVCAVGQRIADLLTNTYGFSVVHDTTNNETTPFTASYDKSLQTAQNRIAENPDLGIFIDVHRDSIDDTAFAAKDIVTKDGKQYARVMFVVGRGDGYSGAEAPDWQANYAVAKAVSDEINKQMPGLSRGVMVKAKRYNQQLSTKSMLIEVGYNANTLTEAENSAEIVALALATVLGK